MQRWATPACIAQHLVGAHAHTHPVQVKRGYKAHLFWHACGLEPVAVSVFPFLLCHVHLAEQDASRFGVEIEMLLGEASPMSPTTHQPQDECEPGTIAAAKNTLDELMAQLSSRTVGLDVSTML